MSLHLTDDKSTLVQVMAWCHLALGFVWGIRWWPVNSPHKGPVMQKISPFDDVIMVTSVEMKKLTAYVCLIKKYHSPVAPTARIANWTTVLVQQSYLYLLIQPETSTDFHIFSRNIIPLSAYSDCSGIHWVKIVLIFVCNFRDTGTETDTHHMIN